MASGGDQPSLRKTCPRKQSGERLSTTQAEVCISTAHGQDAAVPHPLSTWFGDVTRVLRDNRCGHGTDGRTE